MVNFYDEEFSYRAIMDRMMGKIPIDIDKREGSVIYNALAPASAELAQMYIWMQQVLLLGFADTSTGDFLTMRAKELGVIRGQPTRAVYLVDIETEGESVMVPIGTRFVHEEYEFRLIEIDKVQINIQGEPGNNIQQGTPLVSINNIRGLTKVEIVRVIERGSDEESDSSLRNRYYVKSRQEAFTGNKQHYKLWAEEVDGVGYAKVFPLHDGPGTVLVVIVNANYQPPLESLVAEVQNKLDPTGARGEGVAPIGATVTVSGAGTTSVSVKVSAALTIGRTKEEAENEFLTQITRYLEQHAFRLDELRISALHDILSRLDTISDYSNVLINDDSNNYQIPSDAVLKVSSVEVDVT